MQVLARSCPFAMGQNEKLHQIQLTNKIIRNWERSCSASEKEGFRVPLALKRSAPYPVIEIVVVRKMNH